MSKREASLKSIKARWPIDLDELRQRRDQHSKVEAKASAFHTIVLVALPITLIAIPTGLDIDQTPQWLVITCSIIFAVLFMAGLLHWVKGIKQRLRDFDLVCPTCSKEIDAQMMQIAIASGHCGHCGTRLVSEHP